MKCVLNGRSIVIDKEEKNTQKKCASNMPRLIFWDAKLHLMGGWMPSRVTKYTYITRPVTRNHQFRWHYLFWHFLWFPHTHTSIRAYNFRAGIGSTPIPYQNFKTSVRSPATVSAICIRIAHELLFRMDAANLCMKNWCNVENTSFRAL